MPLVTVLNLRRDEDLPAIEETIVRALSSAPEARRRATSTTQIGCRENARLDRV